MSSTTTIATIAARPSVAAAAQHPPSPKSEVSGAVAAAAPGPVSLVVSSSSVSMDGSEDSMVIRRTCSMSQTVRKSVVKPEEAVRNNSRPVSSKESFTIALIGSPMAHCRDLVKGFSKNGTLSQQVPSVVGFRAQQHRTTELPLTRSISTVTWSASSGKDKRASMFLSTEQPGSPIPRLSPIRVSYTIREGHGYASCDVDYRILTFDELPNIRSPSEATRTAWLFCGDMEAPMTLMYLRDCLIEARAKCQGKQTRPLTALVLRRAHAQVETPADIAQLIAEFRAEFPFHFVMTIADYHFDSVLDSPTCEGTSRGQGGRPHSPEGGDDPACGIRGMEMGAMAVTASDAADSILHHLLHRSQQTHLMKVHAPTPTTSGSKSSITKPGLSQKPSVAQRRSFFSHLGLPCNCISVPARSGSLSDNGEED